MDTSQTSLYFFLGIIFIIIGVIIIWFIASVIIQQRYVERLRQSKAEAEITMLENERKRLAGDIHDELGPLLSAAKLKYSEVEYFSKDGEILLNRGHQLMDQIIDRMRGIARDLMPAVPLLKGPVFAISEFIEQMRSDSNLIIEFNVCEIPKLADVQVLHVYRIVQEIIHNTVKHAEAKHLKIEIYSLKDKLIISTVDDGKGFNYKVKFREGRGLGLYNLESRVDILNAQFSVKSEAKKGTKFCIVITV